MCYRQLHDAFESGISLELETSHSSAVNVYCPPRDGITVPTVRHTGHCHPPSSAAVTVTAAGWQQVAYWDLLSLFTALGWRLGLVKRLVKACLWPIQWWSVVTRSWQWLTTTRGYKNQGISDTVLGIFPDSSSANWFGLWLVQGSPKLQTWHVWYFKHMC